VNPLDALLGVVLRLHQRLYEATKGRVGHRLLGVPTLLLHTTGRKTGRHRTSALVYALDGSDYLVVASNGGSDSPPGWLANVRAQPAVEVQVGAKVMASTAVVVGRGDADYEHVWRIVNDNNRQRYAAYQRKTSRAIPVVRLTPSA
jgi:deazaflavin-dependent oxidoreductase (nitroreductase family)